MLAIAIELCEAMVLMHGANLVHRDIAARK
mgnify:CR=1 FL=1